MQQLAPLTAARCLAWLDAHDRALGARLAAAARAPWALAAWRAVTHAGGATAVTLVLLAMLGAGGAARAAGWRATAVVLLSHAAVQLVKRRVCRPRPALGAGCVARVGEPDAFSFPSGHSAAAMGVALGLAALAPAWAGAFVALAMLVGLSRVVLGVHYVGDVLAGQALALAAAALLAA